VVWQCFTPKRMAQLMKLVTTGTPEQRRSILQMFNALHLDIANRDIIPMLAWDLNEEVVLDLQRYLRERSRYGLQFIMDGIFELPPEKNMPLIEIARDHLPRSRPIFIKLIQNPTEPATKVVAVQALAGHLKPEEAKQLVGPLLRASNDKLRMAALRLLSDAAPKFVAATIAPLMNESLREKPEEEVRELSTLFVKLGGELAVQKMKDLVQVGKFANEKERDLALLLVKVLARDASPKAIEILSETAKDWKLHGQVRQAAQELVDILQR